MKKYPLNDLIDKFHKKKGFKIYSNHQKVDDVIKNREKKTDFFGLNPMFFNFLPLKSPKRLHGSHINPIFF